MRLDRRGREALCVASIGDVFSQSHRGLRVVVDRGAERRDLRPAKPDFVVFAQVEQFEQAS